MAWGCCCPYAVCARVSYRSYSYESSILKALQPPPAGTTTRFSAAHFLSAFYGSACSLSSQAAHSLKVSRRCFLGTLHARQVRKAFCSLLPPDPPIHSSTACFHPLPTKLATIRFQVFSPCFPVPRGRERVGEGWQYTVTAEDEGHVIVFQFTPVSSTGGRSTCPRWRLSAQQVGKQWWWSSTGRWGHALALQVHGALIACRVTVK